MTQITYLIGAGASANALPLIKKANSGGKEGLPEELRSFINTNTDPISSNNYAWDNRINETLKQIADKCIEFGTPDLYAKFLLETGDNKGYQLLKCLLSVFFKFKQDVQRCFDFRALTFLTTITQNQKIPDNIKILSWNYDTQIEIAAERLKPVNPGGYSRVNGFTCWPNYSDGNEVSDTPFLFHLNGVAGFNYSERDFTEKVEENFEFKSAFDKESLLSFAWENETTNSKKTFFDNRLVIAQDIAKKTEILVIIGYSFPFFNRVIDDRLFYAMKDNLKKIYYQDIISNGVHLQSRFNLSSKAASNIIPVSQVDNYHIPFEL